MEKLAYFLSDIQDKRVTVIGIGVSNTPLIKMLVSAGARLTARDRKTREQLKGAAEELEALGVRLFLGAGYLDGIEADILFRTPGMRPDVPELVAAQQAGALLTSEMEVFFDLCPCPIVAVTGSDGKTTTTSLIAAMLSGSGRRVFVGGNIGYPLLDRVGEMKKEDICVVELSSFQLMTMKKSAHIAVVTNLSPNHLDMHHGMLEYVESKMNILQYQSFSDVAVLNMDNELSLSAQTRTHGEVRLFSRLGRPKNGAYAEDGVLYVAENGQTREIMRVSDITIPGAHNVENCLAAICAVRSLVSDEAIVHAARTFTGAPHRIELVREKDGVRYYNDSIATSPTRSIAALRSFECGIVLIAGGYDKGLPFDAFGEEIAARVRELVLCGATADKIEDAVRRAPNYAQNRPGLHRAPSFDEAVTLAASLARAGEIVLMSTACASFDQFENFVHRGEYFKARVLEL